MFARAKALGIDDAFKMLMKQYEEEIHKKSVDYARQMSKGPIQVPLKRDSLGKPLKTAENFFSILQNDPKFKGIQYNLLTYAPEVEEDGKVRRWVDDDDANARLYIESVYGIYRADKLKDAFATFLRERSFHPVHEIIENVQWDGVARIEGFLHKWMKCDDNEYTREVSRLIFAGGIHRIYFPGCKFDDMIVLVGRNQGEGKSTIVRWLAVEDKFFREVTEFEGQKGMEAIDGAWICEVGELLALTKTKEQEAVKSYITRQSDVYRRPFDKRISEQQRQCIFIGTTNKDQFLTDKTGGRRFYPVAVRSVGYDLFSHEKEIKADILQCWAEALHKMREGNLPPYADPKLVGRIKNEQENALEDDYRVGMIAKYLKGKDQVCAIELWEEALDNRYLKMTRKDSMEIGLIMQGISSFERAEERPYTEKYGRQRVWRRIKIACGTEKNLFFVAVDEEDQQSLFQNFEGSK